MYTVIIALESVDGEFGPPYYRTASSKIVEISGVAGGS